LIEQVKSMQSQKKKNAHEVPHEMQKGISKRTVIYDCMGGHAKLQAKIIRTTTKQTCCTVCGQKHRDGLESVDVLRPPFEIHGGRIPRLSDYEVVSAVMHPR
jgi:hypothetical protein